MGTKRTPAAKNAETLSVADRLALLSLLPEKGSLIHMRVVADLRTHLTFVEKELKEWGIVQLPDGSVRWDKQKAKNKKVEIGNVARDVIKERLRDMDKNKQLGPEHVPIWDRFIDKD
ncbi:MAG: hypothetical protein AMS20_00065 [Gemmatimonas sp. SG8_28]|nr:MAG: hypothetical protein AMS20_00065 [Gemmatimonas sp. SG8_28]